MIAGFPIGYICRKTRKPFPISILKNGETFNNYNGDLQKLCNTLFVEGKFYAYQIMHLEGLEKGKYWYCYSLANPICYAQSAKIARKWEARLVRKLKKS